MNTKNLRLLLKISIKGKFFIWNFYKKKRSQLFFIQMQSFLSISYFRLLAIFWLEKNSQKLKFH